MTRKLSKITGKLTNLYLPQGFRKPIFEAFAKIYKVDLNDIEEDLSSFPSFNAFFTRKVKKRDVDIINANQIVIIWLYNF